MVTQHPDLFAFGRDYDTCSEMDRRLYYWRNRGSLRGLTTLALPYACNSTCVLWARRAGYLRNCIVDRCVASTTRHRIKDVSVLTCRCFRTRSSSYRSSRICTRAVPLRFVMPDHGHLPSLGWNWACAAWRHATRTASLTRKPPATTKAATVAIRLIEVARFLSCPMSTSLHIGSSTVIDHPQCVLMQGRRESD